MVIESILQFVIKICFQVINRIAYYSPTHSFLHSMG